jgi:chemotaxis protein CheD
MVKLLPGEVYAAADGTAVTTLLGSCVSVCLFDPAAGVGGMNHFLLPELSRGGEVRCTGACASSCCARYGRCAMRQLLQQLEGLGARRPRLAAKLFGAGRVMAGMTDIGANNAAFALDFLERAGIPVVGSDLHGVWPRKVVFFPATGRALVKRIKRTEI